MQHIPGFSIVLLCVVDCNGVSASCCNKIAANLVFNQSVTGLFVCFQLNVRYLWSSFFKRDYTIDLCDQICSANCNKCSFCTKNSRASVVISVSSRPHNQGHWCRSYSLFFFCQHYGTRQESAVSLLAGSCVGLLLYASKHTVDTKRKQRLWNHTLLKIENNALNLCPCFEYNSREAF